MAIELPLSFYLDLVCACLLNEDILYLPNKKYSRYQKLYYNNTRSIYSILYDEQGKTIEEYSKKRITKKSNNTNSYNF